MSDVLIFDIDGTLFDSQKFGANIRKRFIEILNIDEEDLIRANADYYSELESTTDFNPHDITAFIANRFDSDTESLDKVFWQEEQIYKESLFDDAIDVLDRLSKEKKLGIFSQGFEELQKRKIAASGIENYFEGEYRFFHRRKTTSEAIRLLPRGATVIDDSHEVISILAPHINTIWMNRMSQENDPKVKTIHSLKELVS